MKPKYIQAGITYLNTIRMNKEKGSFITYDTLELQDYMQPCANISFEDQKIVFIFRCEINIIIFNFKRSMAISPEYCIKQCQQQLNNSHLTLCSYMNKEKDFRCIHLLNGTLEEKMEILTKIK